MPKMMKKVQQMSTMLPIGRSDDSSVCTTSFRPLARLMTLHAVQPSAAADGPARRVGGVA